MALITSKQQIQYGLLTLPRTNISYTDNLYKIDPNKFQSCLHDLSSSSLQRKNTIFITKNIDNIDREFGATLYLEKPHQSDESISWNWILNEFEEQPFYVFKS